MKTTADQRRAPELAPDEIDVLLRAATLAPSLHNSQPWAFATAPDRVEVYADATRQLRTADPTGRSLLIGCGAAVLNLRVAAEHLGFQPHVRLLPEPSAPTLVAVVELGHRRRHDDGGGGGGLGRYFGAVATRRTNRRPFLDRAIPRSLSAALTEAAGAEGALLHVYDAPDEVARIIDLLHEAELAEHVDPGLATERQRWIGGARTEDGISHRSMGPRPSEPRTAFRDLGPLADGAREYAAFERTPTVAVLSTPSDAPPDWLRAGQALQRLLLVATEAGLSASFLNQPLEQDDLRWLVRNPLDGLGHSQMILRLGYGHPVPATRRRPLAQVRTALFVADKSGYTPLD